MHTHYRITVLLVALAMLFTALPVFAAPNVPGDVTQVTVASPSNTARACVKAGGSFDATYSTDGGGQADPALNQGQAVYSMGLSIPLGSEAVTLPVTNKKVVLTVPSGTADNHYDFTVAAKSIGQGAFIVGTNPDAIIVDSTAPVVPAGTITKPAAGAFLQAGVATTIEWKAAGIKDENLTNGLTLQVWVNGALNFEYTNVPNSGTFAWTPTVVSPNVQIRLIASDCTGATATDTSGTFTVWNIDTSLPVVNVTAPAPDANTWIGSKFTVAANALDPESGITKVDFFYSTDRVNWQFIGSDAMAPYSFDWQPAGIPDGTKVWIKATATNGAGTFDSNISPVDPFWAKVDLTAPAVTLTVPAEGAWVSGLAGLTLTATASDAGTASNPADPTTGIKQVVFAVSKDNVAWNDLCTDTTSPFTCAWADNTANGPLYFRATATNLAGVSAADVNAVTADSTPPTGTPVLTAPNGGEAWLLGSTQNITWNKGLVTDANLLANPVTLKLSRDGVNWTVIATGLADTGTYAWVVNGLPSATSRVMIEYADKAGNVVSDQSNGTFTIYGQDSTPPAVAITAPANGAWFKGAVTVVAMASDAESAIASVQFFVSTTTPDNFVPLGAPDTTAPWEAQFTPMATGAVKFFAVATNGMGLASQSAVVTANFDLTDPTVRFDQPALGAKISGNAYDLIATATDVGSGVAKVEFFRGDAGVQCGTANMKWTALGSAVVAPYKATFNSAALPDGFYCFRAVATDNVGRTSVPAETFNEVDNVYALPQLQIGWNLISSPVMPYNTDIKSVMAGLVSNGSVKQVATFVWISGKLTQQTWVPGVGGTLTKFVDGQGYWVEMTKADTLSISGRFLSAPPAVLPSYGVSVGWNLIGFTATAPETPASYLGSVFNTTQSLYRWDAVNDMYVVPPMMDPGQGFWLATSAAGTIFP